MADRFARRKLWRRFIAVVYVVALTSYLAWRFTIINPDSIVLSIAYYTAEVFGFILGLCVILNTWNYSHREPPPAPDGLSVDVFVPAYKEPLHIIRRTLMAARDIRYPHGTFLLDDGKREDLKRLAHELGVQYLRREGNAHAKAGNLNYGLAHSRADYVMVFDADHIALPHALDVMLGFFTDEKVSMVQTPQDYYNIDAFQYINAKRSGALWHDQSAFYNIAEPAGDCVNASSCVGTGVVYRRSALDRIGGIPTATVTEDIHTSLKLHKAGYETVFLNESIAYGVAASDLSEYYKTRHRWGHGNLHALMLENILFSRGLTFKQRLHYLSLGLVYLEGWQQLLLFTIPLIALVFGLQPFTITIFNVLVVLAFPVLSYTLLQELGCGFARFWANEIFSMARWPVYLASAAGLFGGKMAFKSSSKALRGRVNWYLMMPQLTVMVASICSVGVGIKHLADTGFHQGPLIEFLHAVLIDFTIPDIDIFSALPKGYTLDLVAVAGAWAVYSILRGVIFIGKTLKDARNTHDFFRFRVPVPAQIDAENYACITRLSEDWIQLSADSGIGLPQEGKAISFIAWLPAGPLRLSAIVEKSVTSRDTTVIDARLQWQDEQSRDTLAASLYSVDWHREFLHRNAYFLTPSDLVIACVTLRSPTTSPPQGWHAVLVKNQDGHKHYGILSRHRNNKLASLLVFTELASETSYNILNFSGKEAFASKLKIKNEECLHSLVQQGLDGAVARRYAAHVVA